MRNEVIGGRPASTAMPASSASQAADDAARDGSPPERTIWDALRISRALGAIDFAGARITAVRIRGAAPFYIIS